MRTCKCPSSQPHCRSRVTRRCCTRTRTRLRKFIDVVGRPCFILGICTCICRYLCPRLLKRHGEKRFLQNYLEVMYPNRSIKTLAIHVLAFFPKSLKDELPRYLMTFWRFLRVAGRSSPLSWVASLTSREIDSRASMPLFSTPRGDFQRNFSVIKSLPTARAVISNLKSRGLSTSSKSAIGALSPVRLVMRCILVYPPGRLAYRCENVSNSFGSTLGLSTKAWARW